MSIRFSRVSATAGGKAAVFLVGGIPENQNDLQGWESFRSFTEDLKKDDTVIAHIESFLYGDDAPVDATAEEVAYIYVRQSRQSDFLEHRAVKTGETDLVLWLDK